jgi:hypothetical protein
LSSTYHPICLSHDPALIISRDLTHEEANTLTARDRLGDHQQCDVVIGRFSYPLIEVACLGRQLPGPTGCKGYHSGAEWIDSDWLRLLAAAAPTVGQDVLQPMTGKCWPLNRLNRLRIDLRLPTPDTTSED